MSKVNAQQSAQAMTKSLIATLATISLVAANAQAQTSYTDVTATGNWSTTRWNNTADTPPYTSTYTANQTVVFTSGNYSFAGMGATIHVGNMTVNSGANVTFTANTGVFATGNRVITINVAAGSVLNFNSQSFTNAAGTGFQIGGGGVFGTGAGNFGGGVSISPLTTVVAHSNNGLGRGASNTLNLNGGTIASSTNVTFTTTELGGGVFIGSDTQFGELASNVSIANSGSRVFFNGIPVNIDLSGGSRTLTVGNNGLHQMSGVVSSTGAGNITITANPGANGRIDFTNTSNTFTGNIFILGGQARFSADLSLGNATNDIYIDGGIFGTSNGATFTLGAGREVFLGDAPGTAIITPSPIAGPNGTLTITNEIKDIIGKAGILHKLGNGILELGGANSYTGNTTISQGTIRLITGDDRLPISTILYMGQDGGPGLGKLDLNGFNQQIGGIVTNLGNNTSSATNEITSATPATLTIANAIDSVFGNGTSSQSGLITGSVALHKKSVADLKFAGNNTYTGGTTITDGAIVLAGNGTIGVGNLTLEGGSLDIQAIYPGTYTMGASTTVRGEGTIISIGKVFEIAGTLSPGFSPGIISVSGNLTLASSAVSNFEIDGLTLGDYDRVNVSHLVTFGGTLNLSTGYSASLGDTVQIFNASSYSGSFSTITGTDLGGGLYWSFNASNGTLTVIPEPATIALLTLGGMAMLLRRNRRKA